MDIPLSAPTSTVGRNRKFSAENLTTLHTSWDGRRAHLFLGDSMDYYKTWPAPTVIVSDGGYGILGFEGDTTNHKTLPQWYEPHIVEWSKHATPQTSLWFWNSEVGWASVHPLLEKHGWKYVTCNTWDKGKGHIAGNINTKKIRRFPVVTEVCVHYVFEAAIDGLTLQQWMRAEWERTGLSFKKTNEACGVKDAATRKYFDRGHLWYFPPPEVFEKLVNYANEHGAEEGKPYFSLDGKRELTRDGWSKMRAKFYCPHGYTNVWNRNALRGKERIKVITTGGKAAHLNQKPLDLMKLIIESSSDPEDILWEPFGGLFSASLAARLIGRQAYGCEIDPAYFSLGVERFTQINLF